MFFRPLLVAAAAAVSFGAHAVPTLVTLGSPDWPPTGSTGLATVEFNKAHAGEIFVALGAHAYKNSPLLPNDGFTDFYALGGIYSSPTDSKGYANWSFDFSYNLGTTCDGCTVVLGMDIESLKGRFKSSGAFGGPGQLTPTYGAAGKESWNVIMGFFAAGGILFDPYSISTSDFTLTAYGKDEVVLARTSINVSVDAAVAPPPPPNGVPEPGTLALVGLALAGWGVSRRRSIRA